MKQGVPVAIGAQPAEVARVLRAEAARVGAPAARARPRLACARARRAASATAMRAARSMLPPPSLPGLHQWDNAGIAIAALRASGLALPDEAFGSGIAHAEWPARLQRLHGRLAALLPRGWELWLDGGHNPGAGVVLAEHLAQLVRPPGASGRRHEAGEGLGGVPAPAAAASGDRLGGGGARSASGLAGRGDRRRIRWRGASRARVCRMHCGAIAREAGPARVLICGSLYLAGEVLKQDA